MEREDQGKKGSGTTVSKIIILLMISNNNSREEEVYRVKDKEEARLKKQ